MSADSERYPPPNEPAAFESLCLDLWKEIWNDPGAQKNGRSGQAQAGVDVFGEHQGRQMGVQCKQKDGLLRTSVTVRELEKEAENALGFKPGLDTFILATSGPNDAKVQARAREITEEHRARGLFKVEVWSWTEIWHEIHGRERLLTRILPVYWPRTSGLETARIAPTRLTHGAATLFGRADELARLDAAWDDPKTHLVTLVAWGGVGKTSLVAKWTAQLAARDYDGACYFDWSFYSQGTRETGGPSSDTFIAAALEFFGDAEMAGSPASAWDKGARLAQLVAKRRTLLVLDGLEPLQHPPGPLTGQLKDPAVIALLKGLAATNPGLCLVTTRESVADLVSFRDTTAPEWKLGHLSTSAGVELLKTLGVHGADDELVELVQDVAGHAEESSLDAHPLIREYFARQLRERKPSLVPLRGNPDAWREAHGRLFEHLQESTEHQPDTLEGLQPLYQAVGHGCKAGRQQEADKVYYDRISRGNEAYVVRNLGAFGADLGAVACFFEPPWSRLSPSLTETVQAWLLNQAAFHLRALGRLTEALEPMRAGLQKCIAQEDLKQAAIHASNLSELALTLGDMSGAVHDAEQAVVFADRSDNASQQMINRTTLADALHLAGRLADALERFREAEEMQAEWQPAYPLLYSVQGFQYCDLLLADVERAAWQAESVAVSTTHGEKSRQDAGALSGQSRQDAGAPSGMAETCRDIEQRAAQTLEWAEQGKLSLLTIALDHLTLGRAGLYRAILERLGASDVLAESATLGFQSEIEQAVDGLRRAGTIHHIPRGLLTRAWLRSLTGDADGARADLDEAWEIAERGPMPLYQADVQLHRARLFRDRDALAEARRLIEKHGYGRRLEELANAEDASKHWPDQGSEPQSPG